MNLSAPFIERPVATTLLTVAIAIAGAGGYFLLPVSPLPQVDFPTIQVSASLPGASPETMASSVATPLERQFGHIAAVTEMTSSSFLGNCSVTLQFDLSRNIDAAARDVQAAINAARSQLPSNLPANPQWRKVNPSDAPIMIIALTSGTRSQGQMYDAASSILMQKISQISGVGQVVVGGSALPAVRVDLNPTVLNKYGLGLEDVRATRSPPRTPTKPKARPSTAPAPTPSPPLTNSCRPINTSRSSSGIRMAALSAWAISPPSQTPSRTSASPAPSTARPPS